MKSKQQQVKEFMLKAGQECPKKPEMPSKEVRELRIKLDIEELLEKCEAFGVSLQVIYTPGTKPMVNVHAHKNAPTDIVKAYDAILDMEVVNIGSAVAMGLDMEPGWQEVHRSNMSKFIDGHRRADGKWIRGKSYSPPDLKTIVEEQSK